MGKVLEHRHNRSRVAFMAGTSPTPDSRVTSGGALGNTSSTRHGADGVKKRSSSRDSSRGSSRPTSEGHRHKTEEVERQLNNRALKGSERPTSKIFITSLLPRIWERHIEVEEIMTDKKRRQMRK